ncbi:hypothetical protein D3C75_1122320 [compost metagenome]
MAVHGEGGKLRVLLENVQRHVHHGQQIPARPFEGTAELPVPVGVGDNFDLFNMGRILLHNC